MCVFCYQTRVLWGPGDMSYLSLLSLLPRHPLAFGKHWWLMSKLPRWAFWIPVPIEGLIRLISRLVLSLKRITVHFLAGATELFAKTFSSHFIGIQIKCVFTTHTHTYSHTAQCHPTLLESHHSHTQACGIRRQERASSPQAPGWAPRTWSPRSRMGWEAESEWYVVPAPPGVLIPLFTHHFHSCLSRPQPRASECMMLGSYSWEELGLWV